MFSIVVFFSPSRARKICLSIRKESGGELMVQLTFFWSWTNGLPKISNAAYINISSKQSFSYFVSCELKLVLKLTQNHLRCHPMKLYVGLMSPDVFFISVSHGKIPSNLAIKTNLSQTIKDLTPYNLLKEADFCFLNQAIRTIQFILAMYIYLPVKV